MIKYKEIITFENLFKGFERIKSNAFSSTDSEIKANFTEKKLNLLYTDLKSQKYKPSPSKYLHIPQPDGGTWIFSEASQRDKVVQAAILNLLEPVLENIFLDCSFGARPNLNCHNALKTIKTKWHNINWIIRIDIQKHFNVANYDKLMNKLEPYCDQAAIELIRKLIKCGYIHLYNHPNSLNNTNNDMHQVSIISPILSNLYLHSLDCFMKNELIPKWTLNDERKLTVDYSVNASLSNAKVKIMDSLELTEVKEVIERLKFGQWPKDGLQNENVNDQLFKSINYIRYSDDIMIGVTSTKAEAEIIKYRIEKYLQNELFLKIDKIKSYIKHSSDKNIQYLGFYIRFLPDETILRDLKLSSEKTLEVANFLKYISFNKMQLRIPVDLILQRAVEFNYMKLRKDGKTFRATSCRKLSSLKDELIVQKFSIIIKRLMEYYRPANQYSDLWSVIALYRKSCALTLADKHKLKSAAAVFKKYGPNIKIKDPVKQKETILFYPTSLKTTVNFKLGKSNVSLADSIFKQI
jgi:retron-type reverse transcriptase